MIQKLTPILILACLFIGFKSTAQKIDQITDETEYRNGKFYFANETEIIFSFASIESDSVNIDNVMRWSPVFNYMARLNYDFTKHLGMDIGLGFRNVGFIVKMPEAENNLKKKFRTYNLGLPIGIKIGDLNQKKPFFVFGGFELEMPFQYKEKTFENGDKTKKVTGWFSDRTDLFTQSVYAGIQFPKGFSLKFKYYLQNFFNEDYTLFEDGISSKPYAGLDVRVFYFSITWFPFKDSKSYDLELPKEEFKTTSVAWN